MSPEQASADPHVDHRADIYAFGCMPPPTAGTRLVNGLLEPRGMAPPDTPVPYSPPLEEYFLPNAEKVGKAIRALYEY